jgi:hypothetical protein
MKLRTTDIHQMFRRFDFIQSGPLEGLPNSRNEMNFHGKFCKGPLCRTKIHLAETLCRMHTYCRHVNQHHKRLQWSHFDHVLFRLCSDFSCTELTHFSTKLGDRNVDKMIKLKLILRKQDESVWTVFLLLHLAQDSTKLF